MPSRRSVLAFLGLAPIAVPAALTARLEAAAAVATAADIAASIQATDLVSARLRCVASSLRDVEAQLSALPGSVRAFRLLVADEIDPYPSVPADALRLSRPQAHSGRFLPCTWPGPSGPGPFAGDA